MKIDPVGTAIKRIRELGADQEAKKEAARVAEETYHAELKQLSDLLKPYLDSAIVQYNKKASYLIDPESVGVGFILDKKKFHLDIRLRTATRHEPDEEFDFADEKKVSRRFAQFIAPKLKKAGISLQFEKVNLPVDYFQK